MDFLEVVVLLKADEDLKLHFYTIISAVESRRGFEISFLYHYYHENLS